ncbi:hypothetical protein, partial [Streptomyces sp. NPDC055681]
AARFLLPHALHDGHPPGAEPLISNVRQSGSSPLVAIPDLERRAWLVLLMASLGRVVPTGDAAVDFSRVNFCRVGADADDDVVEALRSGNIDHTRDALIAATARFEACPLVTNERRLANRSRERGIEVLTTHQLLAEFDFAMPEREISLTPGVRAVCKAGP